MIKNNNGFTLIKVIFSIIIIVFIAIITIYFTKKVLSNLAEENIKTEMLQIQAKVKLVTDKNKAEGIELKGLQIDADDAKSFNINENIKQILPENKEKCFIWTNETLTEQGLSKINVNNTKFYIIDYNTKDVLYSEGLKVDNKLIYKLSELE